MILLWILSIIAIIAVSFYQALRFNPRPRLAVLLLLACAIASTPFLLPPGEKIARFCMALMATLTVFKMWDLHVGQKYGRRPNFREYLALLANLFLLVWRKRGIERQPAMSRNLSATTASGPEFPIWCINSNRDGRFQAFMSGDARLY